MSKKVAGIDPHDAMRALYNGAPKKFKLGDVPEGELVIVDLKEPGEPDVYAVMVVQKKLTKTTRLYSVGLNEMTSYHSETDRMDALNTDEVVWLVQATMPVARIPDASGEEGEVQ